MFNRDVEAYRRPRNLQPFVCIACPAFDYGTVLVLVFFAIFDDREFLHLSRWFLIIRLLRYLADQARSG
jgi:hypothetical protein